ncbi:hypothetical protein BgiBS90_026508 [Biomphalaria glabrata]|nr:hypothetical protein BgiBS90_026508 [Biomphalaria glabrata]
MSQGIHSFTESLFTGRPRTKSMSQGIHSFTESLFTGRPRTKSMSQGIINLPNHFLQVGLGLIMSTSCEKNKLFLSLAY